MYHKNFIEGHTVEAPRLTQEETQKFKKNNLALDKYDLDYNHYSVLQNPFRKFPYYSAANIDGSSFLTLDRKGNWKNDSRIESSRQSGAELYHQLSARARLVIHKGHMTKREDVQWGKNKKIAKEAADSTFFYTNAVPQHSRINLSIWKQIENYILHKEVLKKELKICLFTGPILNPNDPFFTSNDESINIQLPIMFWKVIYYLNSEMKLSRTAFMVNQSSLLENQNVIATDFLDDSDPKENYFYDFPNAETYQTTVSRIESLTPLIFDDAYEVYKDYRPTKLLTDEIDYLSIEEDLEDFDNWNITNLKL